MLLTEPELFDWLKEFYYPDLLMSESQYSSFDCYSIKSANYIELKSRNTHYDDLIIEKIKYDAIIKEAKACKLRPVYINSTPEGIWKFKLNKLSIPTWSRRKLPSNTEFGNGYDKYKVVGYLNIKDGVKL